MTKKILEWEKFIKPITMVISERGKPKDGNDWSEYERVEIEIEPTLNAREAAVKASKILEIRGN